MIALTIHHPLDVVDDRIDRFEQLEAQIVVIHLEPELALKSADELEGGDRRGADAGSEQRLVVGEVRRINLELKRDDERLFDAPPRVVSV